MTDRTGQLAKVREHFMDRILVDCPACGGLAIVRLEEPNDDTTSIGWAIERLSAPRRMTCTRCSAHKRQGRRAWARPQMGLPLRLWAETRHGFLYAYNEDHRAYIEDYVRSPIRREIRTASFLNGSVLSRLPAWVKSARNRDEVLKTLAAMRRKLL